MWKKASYDLSSSSTMLMNNGQTADPLNEFSKALKAITSKRAKTDADHEAISEIEFYASLYMDEDGPIIPAKNVMGMVLEAAAKKRKKKHAKSCVFVDSHARLEYEGPRAAEELWEDGGFTHREIVRIKQAKIVRTRSEFDNWTATIEINYEDSLINLSDIDEWLEIAGSQTGIMDYRPQHGRFKVVSNGKNGHK